MLTHVAAAGKGNGSANRADARPSVSFFCRGGKFLRCDYMTRTLYKVSELLHIHITCGLQSKYVPVPPLHRGTELALAALPCRRRFQGQFVNFLPLFPAAAMRRCPPPARLSSVGGGPTRAYSILIPGNRESILFHLFWQKNHEKN